MKNRRWYRLAGWLLTLVMLLTVMPVATFAEENVEQHVESTGVRPVPELIMDEEADITNSVQFAYTDVSGKAVEVGNMDPNKENRITLTVSGLDAKPGIVKETVMTVTLPDNITITSDAIAQFSNDAVSAALNENKLLLSWKSEKQDSFEATFAVLPHMPTENDLSGSYVLGTGGNQYYKVMLGTTGFDDSKNKNRKRLSGTAFEEVDGKVYIFSEESAYVWELAHVSGDYYTVRSKENGKYLKIDDKNNGLILENATELTAQKIRVLSVGNGYYTFSYNKKSINNSSFNPRNGFASWDDTDKGLNAILKLYRPSDVLTEPIVNLSGTWVITNTARKNALTAESHSTNGRLAAVQCTTEGNFLVNGEGITEFTFENIIRDWYTVKTDGGYLNISDKGAFISSNPQHLVVRTDNNYSSIILSNSELYDVGYTLKNVNGKTNDGYGVVQKHAYDDNTRLTLISTTNLLPEEPEAVLAFNMNGGTGDTVPEGFAGASGEKIVLPNLNSTKNGNEFIGWCEVDSVYKQTTGTNHTYHDVYKPGTSYTLKAGNNTLYAIYNDRGSKVVRFGIRKDGVIQDEPNGYKVEGYIGHFEVDKSILKETHWVIDIDSTKPVNGYYVENSVTANLNWVPSSEQIAEALRKEGNVDFDPETQYIHYYVIKCIPDTTWKIDGVIRNKEKVSITYYTNAPAGVDKTKVSNMPGSYQVVPGTDIMIGADENSTKTKRPALKGYYFMGWNSEEDGSGTYYNESSVIHMTKNLCLYAQWISEEDEVLDIRITSDWPIGKTGRVGEKITLTAVLTGFEGKEYTLKWQYSTDLENWTDVPNAHEITYTYILDETTTHYTWRAVAEDIR